MAKVNLRDRRSIERVYSAQSFAADAARNDTPGSVLHGVRIAAAPDAAGDFELEPTVRHVGEAGTAVFLAPHRRDEELIEEGPSGGPKQVAEAEPEIGYRRFIDDIVAAATRLQAERERAPVADDAVLRGPRQ